METPFDKFPIVNSLRSQEEMQQLVKAAAQDNHVACFPSHVVRKEGEMVGYFSVCTTPLVNFWMHSQKVKPRESINLIQLCENFARTQDKHRLVVPCQKSSPFFGMMEKMGYVKMGETVLFYKNLDQ